MIRPLTSDDVTAFVSLRRVALQDDPAAFFASPADDGMATADTVRQQLARGPDWMLFGAFEPQLAGMVGLMRETRLKARHKATVWGMYVAPQWRGNGLGRRLLQSAIDHARELDGVAQVHLCVTEASPAARRLYEGLGFRVWGVEPDAMRIDGKPIADTHMLLRLRD